MTDFRTMLGGLASDQTLSSMYEIEDILLLIGEADRKVDYYKEMKRHRIAAIDSKVSTLTEKVACLRQIVLNTMKKLTPQEKTLDFPDVGKVTRRKSKEAIVVNDQDQVLDFLEAKGVKKQVVRTEVTVDKRKLNTLIQQYNKSGTKVPGITTVPGTESLSITFEKPKVQADEAAPPLIEIDLDALDALSV